MCSHSVRERIACGSCIDYIIIPLCRVFTLCKTAKNKCYGFSHDIAVFRCLNNTYS